MDSRRQLQIASVIQEAFTEILSREGKAIYGKAFVTLTKVKVTSDLSLARFYISVFGSDTPDAVIHQFNVHKFELKRKLSEKIRNQLRVMPDIEFFRDETLDYAAKIDDVFSRIKAEDDLLKAEIEAKRLAEESAPKKRAPRKPKVEK